MFGSRHNKEQAEQPKQERYHAWQEGDSSVCPTDTSGHEYEWYQAMQAIWKEEEALQWIKYQEARRAAAMARLRN